MTQAEELIKRLVAAGVNFVLIGGMAAVAHGSAYVTYDLDICYERTPANIKALVKLLNAIHAKLRDVPGDLPFNLDKRTFGMGMNFTFDTDLGWLDLLGEVTGLGLYPQVLARAEALDLYGLPIKILSIEGLIQAKQASARPKDIAHAKELAALQALKK